ncbi:MAG: hypothetical protein OEN56_05415 [Gemmatimonadota bacterium]|nr:hypothetical protein [Gemmatimonadota bacterium]
MWEVLVGLLVASAVSGVLPIINAEVLVVAAAAAMPAVGVPLVALASTLGQMSTKFSLFAVARWAPSRLPSKAKGAIDRMTRPMEKRGGAVWLLIFASAATGIPPFYGVSLAAGALGVKASGFLTGGCCGRLIRFGVLAWLGHGLGARALETFAEVVQAAQLTGG